MTRMGPEGSGIYMKTVEVDGTHVDVIRAQFSSDFEEAMRRYVLFHKTYVDSKKVDNKAFFVYDLTSMSGKDLCMQAVREFTLCHRNCKVDYVNFLAGTLVLLDQDSGAIVRIILKALQALYTPVRPLRISSDRGAVMQTLRHSLHSTECAVTNDFANV